LDTSLFLCAFFTQRYAQYKSIVIRCSWLKTAEDQGRHETKWIAMGWGHGRSAEGFASCNEKWPSRDGCLWLTRYWEICEITCYSL